MPDCQPSQLLGEDPARAAERGADEPAHSQADRYGWPGHRGVGQPTLVPAVNPGRRIAAQRAHRLVGLSSSMDADHALLM
jgi:hypothetical protein